jgi:4-amino-4-deoxy-L-arabinose transferase-like glycosyltransferase
MAAPDLLDLANAPPWWRVWTKIEVTQPPLYFVLLRLWVEIVGQGDATERLFSVVASMAAIALLFDVARLLNGRSTAAWACLLMALAEPQVEHARLVKNYALLLALVLAAADALVRIEKLGITRSRFAALMLTVLATLLTHYFCIGAIAALFIYAAVRLRGRPRQATLAAFFIAGSLFIVCWGPFMWQQRAMFSTTDPLVMFLHESENHFGNSLRRFLSLPADMLMPRQPHMLMVPMVSGILYVLPFVLCRRRPDLLLWGLWLPCTASVVLALDLMNQTAHLEYIRYTLLAGPAVFALIPAITSGLKRQKWIAIALPATAAIAAAMGMPAAYQTWIDDPRIIANYLRPQVRPNDFLVFIATGDSKWESGAKYMILSRYLRPIPCPIALLDGPANQGVLTTAKHSRRIFVCMATENFTDFLPHTKSLSGRMYIGQGLVWVLEPNHSESP